MEQGSSLGASS